MPGATSLPTLKKLSREERHALRGAMFHSARKTAMGQVASRLFELEGDIRRLRRQLETLKGPRGDRVMAKMVAGQLQQQEHKAIELLERALGTVIKTTACIQLRLLIAERADSFEDPAKKIARGLRRLALDEWLQLTT